MSEAGDPGSCLLSVAGLFLIGCNRTLSGKVHGKLLPIHLFHDITTWTCNLEARTLTTLNQ